jgi:hypothetical protein
MVKLLKKILKWDEVWSIPLAAVLFLWSPRLFRWYDETSGSYDVGILQRLFLALIIIIFANGLAYLLTWLNSKEAYKRLDVDNPNLTEWQKESLARVRFYVYFLGYMLLVAMLK